MMKHRTKLRVRYGETDQMGYLYYGRYAEYYEVGRAEALRHLGFSYKEMEETHGIMMPVVSLSMRFVRPALYDQEITIQTSLRSLPDQFITFHMELYNEENKLLNGGMVKLCFVEKQSRKRVPTPDFLLEVLSPHFSKTN